MNVIKTTDYDLFKGVLGNRELNRAHIVNLSESISRHNMLEQNPIIVNKKMEVIDGQHRLSAARELGLPIFYTIVNHAGIEDIQRLNTAAKPWDPKDYLNSYIALGKEPYIIFNDFIVSHNLSIRQGLQLLKGDDSGESYTKAFKRGLLEFSEEDLKNAENKAQLREELTKYFIDTGYNRAPFFRAIHYLYKMGLSEDLVKKIRVSQQPLRSHTRLRDYVRDFEDILNWRRTQKEHVSLTH